MTSIDQETLVVLTPADVRRLAYLARINLTDAECNELAPQLDLILDSVAVVSKVAKADVTPTSHALNLTNVFREDVVTGSLSRDAVLSGAPETEDDRFKIPQILVEKEAE